MKSCHNFVTCSRVGGNTVARTSRCLLKLIKHMFTIAYSYNLMYLMNHSLSDAASSLSPTAASLLDRRGTEGPYIIGLSEPIHNQGCRHPTPTTQQQTVVIVLARMNLVMASMIYDIYRHCLQRCVPTLLFIMFGSTWCNAALAMAPPLYSNVGVHLSEQFVDQDSVLIQHVFVLLKL